MRKSQEQLLFASEAVCGGRGAVDHAATAAAGCDVLLHGPYICEVKVGIITIGMWYKALWSPNLSPKSKQKVGSCSLLEPSFFR